MTVVLPETDIPIKTHDEPTESSGAIVIRLRLDGIRTVEILASHSDEADQLRELLAAAWPALEWIQKKTIHTGPMGCLPQECSA